MRKDLNIITISSKVNELKKLLENQPRESKICALSFAKEKIGYQKYE